MTSRGKEKYKKPDGDKLVLDCPAHGFWCTGCMLSQRVPIDKVSQRWLKGYWSFKTTQPKQDLNKEVI